MADENLNDAIREFEMPEIQHGETVAYYPGGKPSERPETATVYWVSSRNVHLVTATRGVKEAVKHVEDPRLRKNADQRETGAWDFTDAAKKARTELERIEERVGILEKQLARLTTLQARRPVQEDKHAKKASNGKRGAALKEYHDRVKLLRKAGIAITGRPRRKWVDEQIAKLNEATDGPERHQPSDVAAV